MMNFPEWTSWVGFCFPRSPRVLKTDSRRMRAGWGEHGEAGVTNSPELRNSSGQNCCRCSFSGGPGFRVRPARAELTFFENGLFPCIAARCSWGFLCTLGNTRHDDQSSPVPCVRGTAISSISTGIFGRVPRSYRTQKRSKDVAMTAVRDSMSRRRPFAARRPGGRMPMAECGSLWFKAGMSGLTGGSSSRAGKRWMYVFVSTVLCNGP